MTTGQPILDQCPADPPPCFSTLFLVFGVAACTVSEPPETDAESGAVTAEEQADEVAAELVAWTEAFCAATEVIPDDLYLPFTATEHNIPTTEEDRQPLVDAFGADAVVITGRNAADPYDPKAVRASTGSLFAMAVVSAASAHEVAEWARKQPHAPTIVGTDERGEKALSEHDLRGPSLLVVGNETTGMSKSWFELADATARIPMSPKAASSLNAANAGSVALYEAARQRTAA
jgi:tRNA(Leu) C34 or U34 (ribose-2'-O)-methylase TrmL